MADTNEMALAKTVYADLCAALDKRKWSYKKHDEELVITFSVSGDDIPMEFMLIIDAERQLLQVLSKLPFAVPEDKRVDLAIATCVVSNHLADGSFDFDIKSGAIIFRMTSCFRGSKIGDGLFEYLVFCSAATVDDYNDTFFAISKGMMGVDDLIKKIQG